MNADHEKTKEQLITEVAELRQRVRELETAQTEPWQMAEETVQRERDRAQQYLDIVEVILVALNNKGEITLINKKGCKILGYEEGELIGKNWFDMCLPAPARGSVGDVFQRLMAGEIEMVEYFENPVLTQSGEERIIAWHNTVLVDETGNIVGTLGSGEDITERKRAEEELQKHREHLEKLVEERTTKLQSEITERKRTEEALRESEEKYRMLVEHSHDVVYSVTPDGIITFVSPQIRQFGYAPEDVISQYFLAFVTPAQRQEVLQKFKQGIKNGVSFPTEFQWQSKDGCPYWVEVIAETLYDNSGHPLLQIGVMRNITERKRTDKRIEGQNCLKEDLLRPGSLDTKLKRITDAIVTIFDADFARIWITKPGDLCDSGCFHARLTEGPHVCRYRDRCLHLMASSGRYTHIDGKVHRRVPFGCYKIGRVAAEEDSKFITNDVTHDLRVHDHDWARTLGLVSFAGYQLLSAAGKPIGVLALFSKHVISPDDDGLLEGLANTTAQVIQTARAEEALRESEEQLQHYAAELQEANVELSQYAYIVSHDLRVPLRAILSYAHFLREDLQETLEDEQKTYLDHLDQAVREANVFISDILELSQVGRHNIELETLDVGSFLHSLIASLELPRDVEIVMEDNWPTLDSEPVLFRQIFQNLMSNAVKFNTSPHKRVELGWRTGGEDRYEFFVRDNGIGLDPRHQEKIFRSFERLHTKEEFEGTGIGLAIVKKAVSKLAGSVRVSSIPGEGSTFFVTLPKISSNRQ